MFNSNLAVLSQPNRFLGRRLSSLVIQLSFAWVMLRRLMPFGMHWRISLFMYSTWPFWYGLPGSQAYKQSGRSSGKAENSQP